MSRKHTKIKVLEPEIIAMRAAGKTRREIAEALGLEKVQIKKRTAAGFSAIRRKEVKPSFKYAAIHRHCERYSVKEMCCFFEVSRNGYYKYLKLLEHPAKDFELAKKIRAKQETCRRTYGYRRMKLWLDSKGITKNPKTVLRIMYKYNLLSEFRRRRKWVQMGEHIHKYKKLLNREFNADHPNQKWVTDISYIQTKEGVLYLSMIRDL